MVSRPPFGANDWPSLLGRLVGGGRLSSDEAAAVLRSVLAGEATAAQVAAFVTALRMRGESVEEMTGFVRSTLDAAEPLVVEGPLVDTCGTGGDGRRTINVSTVAAFVVAGAGARVCKHGGRAASSQAGSADVLEALGVVIDLGPSGVAHCIDLAGMGFCFAPRFHPAMRHAAPVRRELGITTVFNFLGPLANPARARRQVLGVSDPAMGERMMGVLVANGTERAIVAWGDDGLDELSTTGPSTVLHYDSREGSVRTCRVDPCSLGLAPATLEQLRGQDAASNAAAARSVLAGDKGPHRDIVLLNAAAGMVVADMASTLEEGLDLASRSLDEGHAATALERLIACSHEAAPWGH